MAEAEFVWIYNPGTGGVALQPALAVDGMWVQLGWERVALDLEAAAAALGVPALTVRQVPEPYVRELAASHTAPAAEPPAAPALEPLPRRSKSEV